MKLIKLKTASYIYNNEKQAHDWVLIDIFIKPDKIVTMYRGKDGHNNEVTVVTFDSASSSYIKETPEEIIKLIQQAENQSMC
jgi:hypothetical protein